MQNILKNISSRKFPFTIEKLNEADNNRMLKEIPFQPDGWVQVGSEKWFMPTSYTEFADKIWNFEVRPDDIFVCTFPRSGITWTQEMIWLICNNLDYETASKKHTNERFPFLEIHLFGNDSWIHDVPKYISTMADLRYESFEAQTTRRFIKTRLPMQLMPRKIREVGAKVVYIARNPKDAAVSFYHFHKISPFLKFTGDFEAYVKNLMDGLVMYGPHWKHILDGWSHRDDENVHFMFYEDLKMNMENSLKKLSNFLELPLREEDLPKLMDYLQFESFKKNPAINFKIDPSLPSEFDFIRRGKIGGNPEITEEIKAKFDKWAEDSLGNVDFKFPFN